MEQHYTTAFQFYSIGKSSEPDAHAQFLSTFQKVLEERIPEDLNVKLDKLELLPSNRIQVNLQGKKKDDIVFVSNIFKELTGETHTVDSLKLGSIVWGSLNAVGNVGFGIFADIGIDEPKKDVLIPLHALRGQLVKDEKIPVREIIDKYGFMDHIPVSLEITKIEAPDTPSPKIEAKFAAGYIEGIKNWAEQGLDIVITVGASRQNVKRAVAKKGHSIDVIEIQRLGALESALICKQGTRASGIISHIGRDLSNCRMSSFLPRQIIRYFT